MARSTIIQSEAVAPFILMRESPRYCAITDGLIGSRTVRHNDNWYQTLGCAQAVAGCYMLGIDFEEHVYAVDSLGRRVISDPKPMVAIIPNDDDIAF